MTEEVNDYVRYEALYKSIRDGNHNDVKTLLKNESEDSLNWLSCCSWSPLLEAAAHGQTDIIWDLINEYGFDVDGSFELESRDEEVYGSGKERQEEHSYCRGTALTLALESGHWPTAALLISEGADANAMFYGVTAQNFENFGYDVSEEEGTCLYLALNNKAPNRVIQLMQNNGLEIDASWGDNNEKDTLLGIAIRNKNTELVSKLLELGADPNQTVRIPHEGHLQTLHFIIHHYVGGEPVWLEIINLLLEHGADNDYEADNNDYDHTGVYEAALSHGDTELIKSLGLMERVVSDLKEAQKIKARLKERKHDLRYSPPELVINLWAIFDLTTGVIYNLLGRVYNVSGNDEEKLEFLRSVAATDYINAVRQPLNPRFVISQPDGDEMRGATFINAINDPQSGVFEDLFEYLESNLPKQPVFSAEGAKEAPKRLPEDPLCVKTILCETETGEIRAMVTDEDKEWVAQYSDGLKL